jgi:hypothetical protein
MPRLVAVSRPADEIVAAGPVTLHDAIAVTSLLDPSAWMAVAVN